MIIHLQARCLIENMSAMVMVRQTTLKYVEFDIHWRPAVRVTSSLLTLKHRVSPILYVEILTPIHCVVHKVTLTKSEAFEKNDYRVFLLCQLRL